MTHNELCKVVNAAYRGNTDICIRTLALELVLPFDVVWECLGFKDYFDFEETEWKV